MPEYPIRVLSLGAGVQSTTVLRMCLAGEIEPIQHAIFADTGWEPKAVYEHLAKIRKEAEAQDVEVHVVSHGNLRDDALTPGKRYASIPFHLVKEDGEHAMARRQCTSEYKLKPLKQKQRELAGLKPGERCQEHRITTLIGISWDETQRMKDPLFPWIQNEFPLVDRRLTRHDCLEWNEKHGFDLPPRSSCIGCPFHNDAEWRAIKDSPEDWAEAVAFDNAIRTSAVPVNLTAKPYLHRSRQPLEEVDLRTVEEKGQGNLFEMECEGMCGL